MRILHERRHPDRKGFSGQDPQPNRRTDPSGASRRAVQVWDAPRNHPGREASGPTSRKNMKPISRREFLRKGRDALIVGFTLHSEISPVIAWSQAAAFASSTGKPVMPGEL